MMPRCLGTPGHPRRAAVAVGSVVATVATLLGVVPAGSAVASVATERTAARVDAGVGQVIAWGRGNYGEADVPEGLRGVSAVAAGTYHNLAVRADGSVLAWGMNYGQVLKVPPDCVR